MYGNKCTEMMYGVRQFSASTVRPYVRYVIVRKIRTCTAFGRSLIYNNNINGAIKFLRNIPNDVTIISCDNEEIVSNKYIFSQYSVHSPIDSFVTRWRGRRQLETRGTFASGFRKLGMLIRFVETNL